MDSCDFCKACVRVTNLVKIETTQSMLDENEYIDIGLGLLHSNEQPSNNTSVVNPDIRVLLKVYTAANVGIPSRLLTSYEIKSADLYVDKYGRKLKGCLYHNNMYGFHVGVRYDDGRIAYH